MFKLYFATPDKKVVADAELEEITLPAHAGELNILPGHAPLMTTLSAGILRYKLKGSDPEKRAISWGYCQISPEAVTVLAESSVHGTDINENSINKDLKSFEAKLSEESMDDDLWESTQHEIARLRAELSLLNEKESH
jgi:F-type H+-transporting ATPase subunit epsilon